MRWIGGVGILGGLVAIAHFVMRGTRMSTAEMIALAVGVALSGALWMHGYFDQMRRGR